MWRAVRQGEARRRWSGIRVRLCVACVFAFTAVAIASCNRPHETSRFNPTRPMQTARVVARSAHDLRMFADQGDEDEAAEYARHIEEVVGFRASGTLDELLAFCGYAGLTAREVETLEPRELASRAAGRVLAVRFFAPGIIDVSGVGGPARAKDLGWRKIVRLAVDPASAGGRKRLASMYLLFNVFQPRSEIALDPFEPCTRTPARCSPSNQVILVPRDAQAGSDALFWLVFGSAAVDGGVRADHLTTTFDGGDQASGSGGNPVKPYYLPAACAQCHGGSAAQGRLNYLDSDHWFDRTRPGDDFDDLAASPNGVLFDGGKDTTSARFEEAFATLAALNRHVRDQNAAVGGDGFGLRAVEHWLALHASNADFGDQVARALPPPSYDPSARQWQDTPEDRAVLRQLNRYCFRCHSSVAYHVFDREAVFDRRLSMARRLELGPLRPGGMPQDRALEPHVAQQLARQLRALR